MWSNIPLATRLGRERISFTEGTVMDTFMVRQAVVVVSVHSTTSDADQVARTTLRPTEFDAGPKIDYGITKCSA